MISIIWDLDGTLIDSTKDIKKYLELAIKNTGIDLSMQIKPFVIGPTIDIIIKQSFPESIIKENVLKKIIENFRELYDNSNFENTKPYNDIEEIIFNNTDYFHHIVTNKPDLSTNRILDILGWKNYISSISTPYTEINRNKKTKTELFKNVINKYNNSCFIGIGDMVNDCIAAKENNIMTIGVLWGTGTKEELKDNCDFLFDDIKQLNKFLREKSYE
ncbi:MAG: HAD family hydrolase [Treponema sp.]|nr:HAD family hydrolase [Treponema sp.]